MTPEVAAGLRDGGRDAGPIEQTGRSAMTTPVSVSTAGDIRSARHAGAIDRVERAQGHLIIRITSGSGSHMIDFARHPVATGQVLHIRPGQVHRFDPAATFEATVVAVGSELVPSELFATPGADPVVDFGAAAGLASALIDSLTSEWGAEERSETIMAASADLLVRHLARAADPTTAGPGAPDGVGRSGAADLVVAFRRELERSHAVNRRASYYASEIGTSTKTLSRATAAVVGRSPKELIDDRVALEAKRLLGCSDDSVATVGKRLGFSEATNFTKFFTRTTGMSPHDFRQLPLD